MRCLGPKIDGLYRRTNRILYISKQNCFGKKYYQCLQMLSLQIASFVYAISWGKLEHKNVIAFIILECGRQRLWEIIESMSKNEILNTCNLI